MRRNLVFLAPLLLLAAVTAAMLWPARPAAGVGTAAERAASIEARFAVAFCYRQHRDADILACLARYIHLAPRLERPTPSPRLYQAALGRNQAARRRIASRSSGSRSLPKYMSS